MTKNKLLIAAFSALFSLSSFGASKSNMTCDTQCEFSFIKYHRVISAFKYDTHTVLTEVSDDAQRAYDNYKKEKTAYTAIALYEGVLNLTYFVSALEYDFMNEAEKRRFVDFMNKIELLNKDNEVLTLVDKAVSTIKDINKNNEAKKDGLIKDKQ